ncbi:uncharacterized protein FFB20_05081 [Fusarium fujikuroi]|uniref:Uncharacterized protein n=1 Tax=Fusarium fujikuroi TaxID=5127 RepID=A0A2H3RV04_FUSFU|nr:uncharacterized protein Y057_14075 [Fusarium fujikuroi]SCN71730.1 uncharacterized protein FFC1_01326 [Fusarium fujikuroi]SCN75929.1 uncharacterized protein FFB20_05081 [Fusarium fujikuroi]VTT72978.1 unnamed protein product [Fusarium fujikuroi]
MSSSEASGLEKTQPAGRRPCPKTLYDYDRMSCKEREDLQERTRMGHYSIMRALVRKRGPGEPTLEEELQAQNPKRRKADYEESDSSESSSRSEESDEDEEDDKGDQQDDSDDRVTHQPRYTHHSRPDIEDTGDSPVVDDPFTLKPDNELKELRDILRKQQSEINELRTKQHSDVALLRESLLKGKTNASQTVAATSTILNELRKDLDRQTRLLSWNTQESLQYVTKVQMEEFVKRAVEEVLDKFHLDEKIKDAVIAQFDEERSRSVVLPTESAKSHLILPVSGIVVSSGTENDHRLDAPENDSNIGRDDAPLQSNRRIGSPTAFENNAHSVIRGKGPEDERPVTPRPPAVTSGNLNIANATSTNAFDSAEGGVIIPKLEPSRLLKDTAKTDSLLTTPARQTARGGSPFPYGYAPKKYERATIPPYGPSQPLNITTETDSLPVTPIRQTTRSASPFTSGSVPGTNGKPRIPSFGLSQPLNTTTETDSLPATPTRQTTRSASGSIPGTKGKPRIPSFGLSLPTNTSTETDSLPAAPTGQTTRGAGSFPGGYTAIRRSVLSSTPSTSRRGQCTQGKKPE